HAHALGDRGVAPDERAGAHDAGPRPRPRVARPPPLVRADGVEVRVVDLAPPAEEHVALDRDRLHADDRGVAEPHAVAQGQVCAGAEPEGHARTAADGISRETRLDPAVATDAYRARGMAVEAHRPPHAQPFADLGAVGPEADARDGGPEAHRGVEPSHVREGEGAPERGHAEAPPPVARVALHTSTSESAPTSPAATAFPRATPSSGS